MILLEIGRSTGTKASMLKLRERSGNHPVFENHTFLGFYPDKKFIESPAMPKTVRWVDGLDHGLFKIVSEMFKTSPVISIPVDY